MKNTIAFLIAFSILMIASCQKQEDPVNKNLIPVKKCQDFKYDAEMLTCCLDSVIQDSRCPKRAVCFWQGIGVARFSVNMQSKQHIITLATYKFQNYNSDTTLGGFKIEMINLLPQKDLDIPFIYDQYVAEVSITKL